jgi:hypothetical protein
LACMDCFAALAKTFQEPRSVQRTSRAEQG